MNRNFLRYIPYAGLAASLVGIVLSVRKTKKMLICSPMMMMAWPPRLWTMRKSIRVLKSPRSLAARY